MSELITVSQDDNLVQSFLKADVEDWCTKDRISRFNEFVSPLLSFFIWGCNSREVIRAWIRREMALDIIQHQNIIDFDENNEYLLARRDAWDKKLKKNKYSLSSISSKELDNYLLSDLALRSWAEKEWGHRLEALYLSRKDQLDRVTCSFLRVSDQNLAVELYYRLKNDGQKFDELSWKFGEGPEKKFGGRFVSHRVQDLPSGLPQFLQRLKPGEVSKPHKIGRFFTIIKLESFEPAQFNEMLQQELLGSELDAWLSAIEEVFASQL
ncbi:peptidylprolyl isomerase [Synechococcus sp. AH-601-P18]|nr:peptidylprolyl isomerase [Synechococcus sp. AH-601-P18]